MLGCFHCNRLICFASVSNFLMKVTIYKPKFDYLNLFYLAEFYRSTANITQPFSIIKQCIVTLEIFTLQ